MGRVFGVVTKIWTKKRKKTTMKLCNHLSYSNTVNDRYRVQLRYWIHEIIRFLLLILELVSCFSNDFNFKMGLKFDCLKLQSIYWSISEEIAFKNLRISGIEEIYSIQKDHSAKIPTMLLKKIHVALHCSKNRVGKLSRRTHKFYNQPLLQVFLRFFLWALSFWIGGFSYLLVCIYIHLHIQN